MISDEERREVAARLRRVVGYMRERSAWYEKEDDVEACGNTAYRNIADSVTPNSNFGIYYIDVVNRIADLIDPTCRNTLPDNWGTFECSECGTQWSVCPVYIGPDGTSEHDAVQPRFCPNCGARVIGGSDAD